MSETNYIELEDFNDFTGRSVRRGDEVVYAVRSGSLLWLKQGIVTNIEKNEEGPRWKVWKISVKVPGGSRDSFLETLSRIVKVRSAKEIELAEREAELRALPQRIVFGFDGSGHVDTDPINLSKGSVGLITFGDADWGNDD